MRPPSPAERAATNFRSWAQDPAPMPMDPELARALALLSRRDLLRLVRSFGESVHPATTLGAARRWGEAIAKHGVVPRRDPGPWEGEPDLLERWVGCWAGLEAQDGPGAGGSMGSYARQWLEGWRGLAGELAPAAEALEKALGWSSPSLAERAASGVERSMRRSRGGRDGASAHEEMRLWMALGASLTPPGSWDAKLAGLAGLAGTWRPAALLARAGARAGPELDGAMRHWINAALSEGVGKRGSPTAKERVGCAQDLLSAMGSSVAGYRSKSGARFDAMAIGAIWSWPDGGLVQELCLAGMAWSPASRAKAPGMAARQIKASSGEPEARQCALRALDAMSGSEGLGPFGRDWEDLARVLAGSWRRHDDAAAWGAGFGRWGRAAGWAEPAWEALARAWPEAAADEGFKAGAEAAQIRKASQGASAPPERAPRRPGL